MIRLVIILIAGFVFGMVLNKPQPRDLDYKIAIANKNTIIASTRWPGPSVRIWQWTNSSETNPSGKWVHIPGNNVDEVYCASDGEMWSLSKGGAFWWAYRWNPTKQGNDKWEYINGQNIKKLGIGSKDNVWSLQRAIGGAKGMYKYQK